MSENIAKMSRKKLTLKCGIFSILLSLYEILWVNEQAIVLWLLYDPMHRVRRAGHEFQQIYFRMPMNSSMALVILILPIQFVGNNNDFLLKYSRLQVIITMHSTASAQPIFQRNSKLERFPFDSANWSFIIHSILSKTKGN